MLCGSTYYVNPICDHIAVELSKVTEDVDQLVGL